MTERFTDFKHLVVQDDSTPADHIECDLGRKKQYYGGGRVKGSTNKLSAKDILESLDRTLGRPYAEQLADNYRAALLEQDTQLVKEYDRLFLSKVIADKVDLTSNGETMREIIQITYDENKTPWSSTGNI